MIKVFIIGGGAEYSNLFKSMGYLIVSDLFVANLAVFTGGSDVSPDFYGDFPHKYTGNSPARDVREAEIYEYCLTMNIPMIGICRGSQFLTVMNGGRMMQHCQDHCRDHAITDLFTGEEIVVSSTHHQIAIPSSTAVLVAVSKPAVQCEWYDGQIARIEDVSSTAEVSYYPLTKSLCFQGHPEFDGYPKMRKYFESLLDRYLDI